MKTLSELLAERRGRLFCSTEVLAPCAEIYEGERAVSVWVPAGYSESKLEFHYSTEMISSDTLRSHLLHGTPCAMIGEIVRPQPEPIVVHPLIMGAAWLDIGDEPLDFDPMWHALDFFEHFVEDIDEFEKVLKVPEPDDSMPMKSISERAFKACLAEILGDAAGPDWGGESSDFYSAHVHLRGRRVTTAFLLKGPARFEPMGLNFLGKNNDQIVRLSHEPADLLVVQHCHDILPPVRETLRAFAVQPSRPRRYCLIDGRDSLRLLRAYYLYEEALELSE